MNQLNRTNTSYKQQRDDAVKGAPYVAGKGKNSYFEDFDLKKVLIQLIANDNYRNGQMNALGIISNDKLKSMNIRTSKSLLANVNQFMKNSEMIIDGEEIHLLEFAGEYISKFMKIDIKNIFRGDIPEDILKGYTKLEDGKLVTDEDKKQEYINTLGG